MKKQLTSQLEKFNAKVAKAQAMQGPERENIEKKIAAQLEDRKQELTTINIMANAITKQDRNMELMVQRMADMERQMAETNDKLERLLQHGTRKPESEIQFEMMLKLHERGMFVSDAEMVMLGVDRYANVLHKHRADQIRETGSFTDPVDLAGWSAAGLSHYHTEEEVMQEEATQEQTTVVVKSLKETPKVSMPRGPKPARIKEALSVIERHTRPESGRYNWREGGVELIFAILTFGQWRGIKVQSAGQVQTDVQTRKAYQQVTLNKEDYGVTSWSDLITKFDMEAK